MLIETMVAVFLAGQEPTSVECPGPDTATTISGCHALQERERMAQYLEKALELARTTNNGEDAALAVPAIQRSQEAWEQYWKTACASVAFWMTGVVRPEQSSDCERHLAFERTHHLWREYIVEMDPESLPEPTPLLPI